MTVKIQKRLLRCSSRAAIYWFPPSSYTYHVPVKKTADSNPPAHLPKPAILGMREACLLSGLLLLVQEGSLLWTNGQASFIIDGIMIEF
ncbi:hypothetical protein ABXS71_13725 [Bacillus infantis]|uniref:hypothetical protein n=1 Tax=Bacillus infantis TaxID=324767 RepID=UPI00344FC55B